MTVIAKQEDRQTLLKLFQLRPVLRFRDVSDEIQVERKRPRASSQRRSFQGSSLDQLQHINRRQVHGLHCSDNLDLFAFEEEKSRDDVAFGVTGPRVDLHSGLWNLGDPLRCSSNDKLDKQELLYVSLCPCVRSIFQ